MHAAGSGVAWVTPSGAVVQHLGNQEGLARMAPAKMEETEQEFFNDLVEVKIKFLMTRPHWNEPQAKSKLY